jgi:hypothetical protein
MEIKADIVDYMGKYENGVLVLLSINCDGSFSEGTVFYTEDNLVLTVDQSVEDKVGPIEEWSGYKDLLESIFKKLIPCSEISTRIDDLDLDKYVDVPEEAEYVDSEINPDDIILATQSNLPE